jgi:para-nitrobenzyl esterase
MRTWLLLWIWTAVAILTLTRTAAAIDPVVRIDSGAVEGVPALTPGVTAFEGIPYAAAPIGDLRWKPPQPVEPWPNPRNADRYGPACLQYYMGPLSTANFGDYETKSEDCLYINVWTPAKSASDRLPVLLWIHGGGFMVGSGTERLHHGDNLAVKGAVVVTFNYRLGIFGFFAHPELTKESGHNASGNYGLMDQLAALQWVQHNIAAFGGDPNRVAIFGESAGGGAVSYMQASPLAKGLFQRAIGESGGSFSRFGPGGVHRLPEAEQNGMKFAQSVGADSLAELRSRPADQIQRATRGYSFGAFGPFVDGYVVPEDVYSIFAAGKQNDVPVLVGSNADEGTSLRLRPSPLETPELQTELDHLYPPDEQEKIVSATMLWTMRTWARLQTRTGTHKAYQYYFSHHPPFPADAKFERDVTHWGAFHSAEIIYVFNNLAIRKARNWPWQPWDWKLSDMMSSYWVNFAANGDPNGPGLPKWPAYDDNQSQVMNFGDTVQAIPMPRTTELEFWDRVNHIQPAANAAGKP